MSASNLPAGPAPLTGIVGVNHLFTERGLGAAPFTIERHDPPWSHLSGCDYCGTGIKEKFYLRSADGKSFKVGNECIKRAGGAGLFSIAQRMHREAQSEQRRGRATQQLAALRALLESSQELRDALDKEPHPFDYRAARNETMLSYLCYLTQPWASQNSIREARRILKARGVAP